MIEKSLEDTDHRMLRAYGKHVIARIYSSTGKLEKAISIYNSVVRSFEHQAIPLLACIALNNRGVVYYRMEELEKAVNDWRKAIKYAKQSNSNYSEAVILTNIADMDSMMGNHEKGLIRLKRSENIFKRFNDLEGFSIVEFNRSLIYLDMKELEMAREAFIKGTEVAYPLPPPNEAAERIISFLKRARDNGFSDLTGEFLRRG